MPRRAQYIIIGLLAMIAAVGITHNRLTRFADIDPAYADLSRRIDALQCTPAETAVQRVGWYPDLPTAFAVARKTGRPLFVVTESGDVCTGRL